MNREDEDMLNKYIVQKQFCEKNGYPLFAPKEECVFCGAHIWEVISDEKASNSYITGCPICHHTYCD